MTVFTSFWRHFEAAVCAVIFAGMTALGFINICVRYLSNFAFAYTEELLLQGFLLLTLFGAALAAAKGEHLAVTFFTDIFGRKVQKAAEVFAAIVSILLLAAAAWFCTQMALDQKASGVVSSGMQVKLWYVSAILPAAFALITLRIIQRTASVITGRAPAEAGVQ